MKTYRITQRLTAAFSLVEVTLALGVAGFCLIAILGLLPAGLNTNQSSVRQTTANGIMSSIVADLRATPATLNTSNLFQIDVTRSNTLLYFAGDGTYSTSAGTNTIFYALVTFSRLGGGGGDNDSGDGGSNGGSATASFYDVKVFWPYSAAAAAAAGAGGSGGADNDSNVGGDNDSQGGGSGGSGNFTSTAGGIVETFVSLDRFGSNSSHHGHGGD